MKTLLVTSSWDDGHRLDMRLSDLLSCYGMVGTFYITKNTTDRLQDDDIRTLATRHEVGAHTLTHPDLTTLSEVDAFQEIEGSKQWLATLLGQDVPMFCYPKGRYNAAVARLVQKAGFAGARTVEAFNLNVPPDPFQMGTTLHVYPFPFRKVSPHLIHPRQPFQPLLKHHRALRNLGVPYTSFVSWSSLARAVFQVALAKGDVFHLWGHSWEIDKYQMWGELESFLSYVKDEAARCRFVTNRDILSV